MSKRPVIYRRLGELAEIRPSYPFRGRLPEQEKGDTFVVQSRHVIAGEPLDDPQGLTLNRVTLPGRKSPDHLWPGDVLFLAKGTRNHATAIERIPSRTVCTPNLYNLRIKPDIPVLLPEFLAWQLNHGYAQRYFATCAQGSVAPSITKAELENLTVAVPGMEQQWLMLRLAKAALAEERCLNRLITNRQRQIEAVGHQILYPDNGTSTL